MISYRTDVAPHLQRSLMVRRLRLQRWQVLHAADGHPDYDPYDWAETARPFEVLAGLALLVWLLLADSEWVRWFRPAGRQAAAVQ